MTERFLIERFWIERSLLQWSIVDDRRYGLPEPNSERRVGRVHSPISTMSGAALDDSD